MQKFKKLVMYAFTALALSVPVAAGGLLLTTQLAGAAELNVARLATVALKAAYSSSLSGCSAY